MNKRRAKKYNPDDFKFKEPSDISPQRPDCIWRVGPHCYHPLQDINQCCTPGQKSCPKEHPIVPTPKAKKKE